ncbi:MAG: hypothetical protein K9M99_00310 [Candidatus Cloacimonetes bacterium]|nr:hypothetical protein [Candidatus Cloacimonadota bacterium]
MNKKVITVLFTLLVVVTIFGEEITNDIFQVEYSQKNARQAMLFSAIVPGVGQLYANPNAITGYIFPVLEFGLWYGYFYYQSEGDDITKQYEDYADQHYDRDDQWHAQKSLIDNPLSYNSFYAPDDYDQNDLYDYGEGGHFRLDHEDTQHFYEDIAKYNKYLFGWEDWTDIYATISGSNTWTSPQWIIENNEYGQGLWAGNNVVNPGSEYYTDNESLYNGERGIYSVMRQSYIEMRRETEDNYDKKRYCSFGLLFNHLLATIDAVRVTRKYNIEHLTSNPVDINFSPRFADGEIAPSLTVSYRF